MRQAFVLFAILLLAFSAEANGANNAKPNIVFMLFDDLGYGQPPCYDSKSALRTPNLDRLASQGMRFTDAHSASSVCTPTRYGLLTGRYPARIGQFGVLSLRSPPIIPTSRLTVASLLKREGYATACVGKWHLGMNWETKQKGKPAIGERISDGPLALGFDYFCGYTEARDIDLVIEQDRVVAHLRNESENQPLMIEKAVEWIGERKPEEPFFLYFPVCPPHLPVAPSPEYLGKSDARDIVRKDPLYGDWVFQGDAMLGRIMEALEKHRFAENTLLIVSSDNGAAGRAYAPLRDSKTSIYEGGHRVPYVARWPGKVKPGSTWNHTICLNDLMATAAEITGAKLPDDAAEDSVSILPALLGTSDAPTREAVIHQSYSGDLAVRHGEWKAIYFKDGKRELYDLTTDIGERHDRSAEHPEVMSKLTALFERLIDQGRSTPGAKQRNEYALSLEGKSDVKKGKLRSATPEKAE